MIAIHIGTEGKRNMAPLEEDIEVVQLQQTEIVLIDTDGGVIPMAKTKTDTGHLGEAVGIELIPGREVGLHKRTVKLSLAVATIGIGDALGHL